MAVDAIKTVAVLGAGTMGNGSRTCLRAPDTK